MTIVRKIGGVDREISLTPEEVRAAWRDYETEYHTDDILDEIENLHGVSRPEKEWLTNNVKIILAEYEKRLVRDDTWWYCLNAAIDSVRAAESALAGF